MATPRRTRFAAFAMIAIAFLYPSLAGAQKCDGRGVLASTTDAYENVPQFVTGRGWQGKRIASLRQATQVYICSEQNADFGLSTKAWLHVAFRQMRNGKEEWVYGWVLGEAVTSLPRGRSSQADHGYSIMKVALADQSATPSAPAENSWSLGSPPSAPPAVGASSPTQGQTPTTIGDLAVLYRPLFIAMLLGMIAKTAVDWLDTRRKGTLIEHLRNGSIAVLVSPIVFLGFLQAGEFNASTQAFAVLCLLAFQNGFFWQTVLKRNV